VSVLENGFNKMRLNCAVVGYGPAFNMGKSHCEWIKKTEGLRLRAVCDSNNDRTEVCKKDFPDIKTYSSLDDKLKKQDIDLVSIVTPHSTHAKLTLQCLRAGKDVIVEKPMCLTTEEATSMIEEAKTRSLMLSVFHNRRFDGDFLAMKDIINKGLIGTVFYIEVFIGCHSHPGYTWRSDKKISGGLLYDTGSHAIDQILNLIPEKVIGVSGFFHKLVWNDVTNEDQTEVIIHFKSGVIANLQISNIASISKPFWRILGTKGGILNEGGQNNFKVTTINGLSSKIKIKETDWSAYYRNISDHLFRGAELKVKPEEARRVIAIIETAEKSAKSGKTENVPYP
jgi:predicted dehydrogenase